MTAKEYKLRRKEQQRDKTSFSLRYNKRFPASLPSLLFLDAPHEQRQQQQQQQQQQRAKAGWTNSSNLLAHGLELDYNPQLMAWQAKQCHNNADSHTDIVAADSQQHHHQQQHQRQVLHETSSDTEDNKQSVGLLGTAVRRSVKNKSDYKLASHNADSALLSPLLQPIVNCSGDNDNDIYIGLDERQQQQALSTQPDKNMALICGGHKSLRENDCDRLKVATATTLGTTNNADTLLYNNNNNNRSCNSGNGSSGSSSGGGGGSSDENCLSYASVAVGKKNIRGGNSCDRVNSDCQKDMTQTLNTFNHIDTNDIISNATATVAATAVNLEQQQTSTTTSELSVDTASAHNQQQQQQKLQINKRHYHRSQQAQQQQAPIGSYYPTPESSYIIATTNNVEANYPSHPSPVIVPMIESSKQQQDYALDTTDYVPSVILSAAAAAATTGNASQSISMRNDDIIEVVTNNNNNNNIISGNATSNFHQQQRHRQQDTSDSIMLDIMNRFNIIRGRHQQQPQQQRNISPPSLTTANSNSNLASRHYDISQQPSQQVSSRIMKYTPRPSKRYIMSSPSSSSSSSFASSIVQAHRPPNINNTASGHRRQQQPVHNNNNNNYYNYNNNRHQDNSSQIMQTTLANYENHHNQRHYQKPSTVMCRGHFSESQISLDSVNTIELEPAATTSDSSYTNNNDDKNNAHLYASDISDTMTICSTSSQAPFCKICHVGSKRNDKLISPCKCSGTMQYIHCGCLLKWLEISNKDTRKPLSCELCNYEYLWHTKFDLRCWRLPNCSCKDILLHTIFVGCILTMIACAVIFVLFVNESNLDGMQANIYHHKYPSSHSSNNHTELSSSEKATLMCGALLFLSFFLAMYVQIKADSTLYKLLIRFIYLNQKFYITEYDHSSNSDTSRERGQSLAKNKHISKCAVVTT